MAIAVFPLCFMFLHLWQVVFFAFSKIILFKYVRLCSSAFAGLMSLTILLDQVRLEALVNRLDSF